MAGIQLYYQLRPSRFLGLLYFFLCVVALVSLWLLPFPKLVSFTLALTVIWFLGYNQLRDSSLRMEQSCVAFRLEGHREVVLIFLNGRHLSGRVLPDTVVTPYIVILNVVLSEQHGLRSLLILPDAVGVDSFRRLRVALCWGDKADQVVT